MKIDLNKLHALLTGKWKISKIQLLWSLMALLIIVTIITTIQLVNNRVDAPDDLTLQLQQQQQDQQVQEEQMSFLLDNNQTKDSASAYGVVFDFMPVIVLLVVAGMIVGVISSISRVFRD